MLSRALGWLSFFVEAPVDPEVADSTKLCDFLANLALKKQAPMSLVLAPLEEIPATASVFVPSAAGTKGIQVDLEDPVAVKRNAFMSLVSRPLPLPVADPEKYRSGGKSTD
jgi:hypothetical protein